MLLELAYKKHSVIFLRGYKIILFIKKYCWWFQRCARPGRNFSCPSCSKAVISQRQSVLYTKWYSQTTERKYYFLLICLWHFIFILNLILDSRLINQSQKTQNTLRKTGLDCLPLANYQLLIVFSESASLWSLTSEHIKGRIRVTTQGNYRTW